MLRVPPSDAAPVMGNWVYCVPGVRPPSNTSSTLLADEEKSPRTLTAAPRAIPSRPALFPPPSIVSVPLATFNAPKDPTTRLGMVILPFAVTSQHGAAGSTRNEPGPANV